MTNLGAHDFGCGLLLWPSMNSNPRKPSNGVVGEATC